MTDDAAGVYLKCMYVKYYACRKYISIFFLRQNKLELVLIQNDLRVLFFINTTIITPPTFSMKVVIQLWSNLCIIYLKQIYFMDCYMFQMFGDYNWKFAFRQIHMFYQNIYIKAFTQSKLNSLLITKRVYSSLVKLYWQGNKNFRNKFLKEGIL